MVIGSEGTLGFVTKAVLKCAPLPKAIVASHLSFKTLEDAAKCVIEIKREAVSGLAKMEIINIDCIKCINEYFNTNVALYPCLFLELWGNSVQEANNSANLCRIIAEKHNLVEFKSETEESAREKLWEMRSKSFVAISKSRKDKPNGKMLVTDVCVPISRFADIIALTEKEFEKRNLSCPIGGHSADGNFHIMRKTCFDDEEEVRLLNEAVDIMVNAAIEMGGTCSGEHGIGLGKMKYMEKEFGQSTLEVMRAIKKSIDPLSIMNPGKVIPDRK